MWGWLSSARRGVGGTCGQGAGGGRRTIWGASHTEEKGTVPLGGECQGARWPGRARRRAGGRSRHAARPTRHHHHPGFRLSLTLARQAASTDTESGKQANATPRASVSLSAPGGTTASSICPSSTSNTAAATAVTQGGGEGGHPDPSGGEGGGVDGRAGWCRGSKGPAPARAPPGRVGRQACGGRGLGRPVSLWPGSSHPAPGAGRTPGLCATPPLLGDAACNTRRAEGAARRHAPRHHPPPTAHTPSPAHPTPRLPPHASVSGLPAASPAPNARL